MILRWMKEIREKANPDDLGMVLAHNGIVRGTSKDGRPVGGIQLSHDEEKLVALLTEFRKKPGITDIRVWINDGDLKVGDDIMIVMVAGRFRTDVLPVFEEVISTIKGEIVEEKEIACR